MHFCVIILKLNSKVTFRVAPNRVVVLDPEVQTAQETFVFLSSGLFQNVTFCLFSLPSQFDELPAPLGEETQFIFLRLNILREVRMNVLLLFPFLGWSGGKFLLKT